MINRLAVHVLSWESKNGACPLKLKMTDGTGYILGIGTKLADCHPATSLGKLWAWLQ
jgi:hypothetical protein